MSVPEPPPLASLWPLFAVLAILMVMTATIVLAGVFAPSETIRAMIDGRIVSRGIVLFLIIPIIAILCVQERISGEAAISALSAIAGYILGGTTAN